MIRLIIPRQMANKISSVKLSSNVSISSLVMQTWKWIEHIFNNQRLVNVSQTSFSKAYFSRWHWLIFILSYVNEIKKKIIKYSGPSQFKTSKIGIPCKLQENLVDEVKSLIQILHFWFIIRKEFCWKWFCSMHKNSWTLYSSHWIKIKAKRNPMNSTNVIFLNQHQQKKVFYLSK